MNQAHPHGARDDILAGIAFCALGVYLVLEGLAMPAAGGFIEEGGEPGRVPVMLGAIIGALGAALLARSGRAALHGLRQHPPREADPSISPRAALTTALGCSLYGVVLMGLNVGGWDVPFSLVTALFVFGFIVLAEQDRPRRLQRFVSAAIFALAVGLTVSVVFERWFFVALP